VANRTDIYRSVIESKNLSRRILTETLPRLESSRLVSRKKQDDSDLFQITADGIRTIEEYDRLAADSQLENLPAVARELRTRHDYPFLLQAQREFFTKSFPPKRNLVILASPSAGKTFMAECCILEELQRGNRVLYITPYKALNRQKHELFSRIFNEYSVVRTDGDTYTSPNVLSRSELIVATYEKALLGVLREENWLKNISLIIADEITVLGEEERGPNLDLLLTLLKEKSQILTLSSYIGNKRALAEWLEAEVYEHPPHEMKEEFLVKSFDSKVRLENKTGSLIEEFESESAFRVILDHSALIVDSTMMVLVGRRDRAEDTAEMLSRFMPKRRKRLFLRRDLVEEWTPLIARLSSVLERGVAFHHAGLPSEVRKTIEDLLAKRRLNIVVSTPTLSHGVDFPIDHLTFDLDSFGGEKLSRVNYLQYRGRASRIGLSKDGNVYVLSQSDTDISMEALRRFLAKPVEPLTPPFPEPDQLEWMVLLACRSSEEVDRKSLLEVAESLVKGLLAYRCHEASLPPLALRDALNRALSNLVQMGVLSVSKNRLLITDVGKQLSKIDLVPRDSNNVLGILNEIAEWKSEIDITTALLKVAVSVGLVRRFDTARVGLIMWHYLKTLHPNVGTEAITSETLREDALASILREWIDEVPIARITSDAQIHDEDVRKLGTYASVEMSKIATLAEELGYRRVSKTAKRLSVRLKHGVKDDLVCKGPAVELFRLGGVGRKRARQLQNSGFTTLLDIYSVMFDKGPEAFRKKVRVSRAFVESIMKQLKTIVKEDKHVLALCRNL